MNTEGPNKTTGQSQSTPSLSEANEQVKTDLRAAGEQAKSEFEAVKSEAKHRVEDLRHEAEAQIGEVTQAAKAYVSEQADRARSFASEQKDVAATQLGGVASALTRVADELQEEQGMIAGYTRDIAHGLQRVSDTVKDRPLDDIVGMVEDFGRRQPVAFLGAAALAGFVASRFALASSHRRAERDQGTHPARPNASGPSDVHGRGYADTAYPSQAASRPAGWDTAGYGTSGERH